VDQIQERLLAEVAGFHEIPAGAYNIRVNGKSAERKTTANIDIVPKKDGNGIEIYVKPGTNKESLHIPVLLSQSGLEDTVYNDFYIGEGADIVIIAGCGIHNGGSRKTQHDGIHTFYIEKGARLKYVEKHYGQGEGTGERVLNPKTVIHIKEDGYMEIDSVQIKGVDSTIRETRADLMKGATLVVKEKIMTHGSQTAETSFDVTLDGERASANVVSHSVARDMSRQIFLSKVYGNAACVGHTECDSIIMDDAYVGAIPEIHANHQDASLVHEAAIGKIAGEQLIKLMTLGLTKKEAEAQIINGFLK